MKSLGFLRVANLLSYLGVVSPIRGGWICMKGCTSKMATLFIVFEAAISKQFGVLKAVPTVFQVAL